MKQRKAWAALLGIATIGLTGCPGTLDVVGNDSYLGLPTRQRPAGGDQLPGSQLPGGGGTEDGSSTGGNGNGSPPGSGATFGESGTNPGQVALASETPLRVEALFPKTGQTQVSISNANRGMLAMAGFADLSASSPTQPTLSVTWPGATSLLSLGSGLHAPVDAMQADEASFKRELRRRLGEATLQSRGYAATRGLIGSTPPSVWIMEGSTAVDRTIKIYPVETLIHKGRTTRFALAVDTADDQDIFGGNDGTKLRTNIISALRENIIPSLQEVYGGIPTQSEASAKKLAFQDDVTYFIFSSRLKSNLLGYFNPGDFFDGPRSNQIRALYLSANAAHNARTSTTHLHDLLGTIVHELQHLQFAWNRVKVLGGDGYRAEAVGGADIWIDEGLAMLATANAGYGLDAKPGVPKSYVGPSYNLAGHVSQFLSRPGDYSLVAFHQNGKVAGESGSGNPSAAYGMAYLFAQYMVDQFRTDEDPHGTAVIKQILSSTKNGLTSGGSGKHDPLGIVNDGLARHNVKLSTLFTNFAAALALDGTEALEASETTVKKRYDIQRINLRQSPFPLDFKFSGPVAVNKVTAPPRPYGIRILNPGWLDNPSTLSFTGNSNVSTRLILHR